MSKQKPKPKPKKTGAPTKYREEFAEQAYKFCLLGADDERLAQLFGVHVAQIHRWKLRHPAFRDALKNGKAVADATVAESLYKRATGYSHPDTDIRVIDGKIVMTPITKHYPPDTLAALSWMHNRQPEAWKRKHTALDALGGGEIKVVIKKKPKAAPPEQPQQDA